jgi:hypothetical protein
MFLIFNHLKIIALWLYSVSQLNGSQINKFFRSAQEGFSELRRGVGPY